VDRRFPGKDAHRPHAPLIPTSDKERALKKKITVKSVPVCILWGRHPIANKKRIKYITAKSLPVGILRGRHPVADKSFLISFNHLSFACVERERERERERGRERERERE
jgi:hypothetical protein